MQARGSLSLKLFITHHLDVKITLNALDDSYMPAACGTESNPVKEIAGRAAPQVVRGPYRVSVQSARAIRPWLRHSCATSR